MKATSTKILSSEKTTLAAAVAVRDDMRRTMVKTGKFWPVIVHGPNDGYMVVEAGFASANQFEVVR